MSFGDFLKQWEEQNKARTRHERHGAAEIRFFDDRPIEVTGCVLPDGALGAAVCLMSGMPVTEVEGQVWTRKLPGTCIRRRGRIAIAHGVAVTFVDENDAEFLAESEVATDVPAPNLEKDLARSQRILTLVRSDLFAGLLYGALCNTEWRHAASGTGWSCSWRSAGGIIADLRGEGDYLDWYCWSGEGLVDEQVFAEIRALGWDLVEAHPPGDSAFRPEPKNLKGRI